MPAKESKSERKLSNKGKRYLKDREPKIFENTKKCLILYGRGINETLKHFATDMNKIMQPFTCKLQFHNDIVPFENVDEIERLCRMNDTSLFCFLSHNKKRPNNVIFGRLFDYRVLDMFEFNLDMFVSSSDIPSPKPQVSAKPLLVFQGDGWTNDFYLAAIRSIFLDLFRGQEMKQITHTAIKHCFVFTANSADVTTADPETPDGKRKILVRSYTFKSDTEKKMKLIPMGPWADFIVRRCQFPEKEEMRRAMIRPRTQADDAVTTRRNIAKNADFDELGNLVAKIYTERQDYTKLNLRKFKALKSTKKDAEFKETDDNQENNSNNNNLNQEEEESSLSEELVGIEGEKAGEYYYDDEQNDDDYDYSNYEEEEESKELPPSKREKIVKKI